MKIAIIGAGNMGGAIARGIASGSIVAAKDLCVSDVSELNLQGLQAFCGEIKTTTDNKSAVADADIILLAVKPWLVETVAKEIKDSFDPKKQILVSIAAGVNLETLQGLFAQMLAPAPTCFRIIPNTAIDVKQSVNTIATANSTPEQNELILRIFNELGQSYLVPESQLNALMALSSCGIAYAFRYIRAAMEGGVEMGIAPAMAKSVVAQTLRGAIDLLEQNQSHPEVEIDKVTTPGGITIKGLNRMEAEGFTNAVIEGLKASLIK